MNLCDYKYIFMIILVEKLTVCDEKLVQNQTSDGNVAGFILFPYN